MGHFIPLNRSEFLSALEDWRSGKMTETDAIHFQELLRNDVNACQLFIEYGDMLSHLSLEVPKEVTPVDVLVAGIFNKNRLFTKRFGWLAFAAGFLLATTAAVLIGAILLNPSPPMVAEQQQEEEPIPVNAAILPLLHSVATVRDIYSVGLQRGLDDLTLNAVTPEVFTTGTALCENDELVLNDSRLFVAVEFISGASLLLQGPAKLVFKTENSAELKSGRALGAIPPSAVGFTLHVPSGLVRDLGTEFAVDANERQAQISVQVGEVECELKSLATSLLKTQLYQGKSACMDNVTKSVQVLEGPPASLREIVKFHSGIVGLSGSVQFSREPVPLEQDPRSFVSDAAVVYQEREKVLVNWFPETSEISIASPQEKTGFGAPPAYGGRVRFDQVSPRAPMGTAESISADSYFVRLKTKGVNVDITGTITFRHPILGVIFSDQGLMSTDEALARPEFAAEWRQLSGEGRGIIPPKEFVEISPDGHTIKFAMQTTGGGGCDELRILVRHPGKSGR